MQRLILAIILLGVLLISTTGCELDKKDGSDLELYLPEEHLYSVQV